MPILLLDEPLRADQLGEEHEQRLLGLSGGSGLLCPYMRHDPAARPLILVHGFRSAGDCLSGLGDIYQARPGWQVWYYLYDDQTLYVDRAGDELAALVGQLLDRTPHARPHLRIVAHSMGGIVSRCALNSLVRPDWLPPVYRLLPGEDTPVPVRGMDPESVRPYRLTAPLADRVGALDLVAIDTPWHGFLETDKRVREMVSDQASYVDLLSNSAVMDALTVPVLPGHFRIHHVEADNVAAGAAPDKVMGLGELDDVSVEALIQHLSGDADALAGHRRLHNLVDAVEDAHSFRVIQELLRLEGAGVRPARFRELWAAAVPRLAGTHESILRHPELPAILDRFLGVDPPAG